jgi:hypothetical protein
MDKKLYDDINSIMYVIQAINSKGSVKVHSWDVDLIHDIYKRVAPNRRLNTACSSCVEMAVSFISAYYDNHLADYLAGSTITVVDTPKKMKRTKNG